MAEDKKSYHQQVAEEIIQALKDGTAPWVRPWEPGQIPDGPVNAATGKPYRGINHMRLTMLQGTNYDPRWCTYKQAQGLGAQVKKGSKGTSVQYWVFDEKQAVKDDQGKPVMGEDGKAQSETVKLERPKCIVSTVFHASQIENLPPLPPREPHRPEWERHQEAEKLLTASKAAIFHDQANKAFYQPSTDEIHLPPRDQFSTPDKYYATALHEVGHWTGHESRLNRDIRNPFGSEKYAREELRAEIASYMLGGELGIGHDPSQHHAYVATWIEALEKDPREIIRAAQDAERIKGYVMGLELGKEEEKAMDAPSVPEHDGAELSAAAGGGRKSAILAQEKTWLNVHYLEREAAKAVGAKWDRAEKSWYAPKGTDLTPLSKWLREKDPQEEAAFDLGKAAFADGKRAIPVNDKEWSRFAQEATSGMETVLAFKRTAELAKAWQKGWTSANLKAPVSEKKSDTLDPRQEFGERLRQAGFILEDEPVLDGKIHRVAVEGGGKGAKDGAYSGYENDGHPGGWWQNHKTGEQGKWQATGHVLSAGRKAELNEERNAEIETARTEAIEKAKAKWQAASQDKDAALAHPYLQDKGIATLSGANLGLVHPHDLPRLDKNGNLLVPGYNFETGEIQTLQTISPNGEKRFERGCPKSGALLLLPTEKPKSQILDKDGKEIVLMAEGYATGVSLHAATGLPVAIAFDAGNLKEAAMAIKKKLPNAAITICADNDHNRPDGKNIGVIKAKEAAAEVGCKVMVADFLPDEKKKGLTDFNDLQLARGLDAVRRQVEKNVFADKAAGIPLKDQEVMDRTIKNALVFGTGLITSCKQELTETLPDFEPTRR